MFHPKIFDVNSSFRWWKSLFWPYKVILVVLIIELLILLRIGVQWTKISLPFFDFYSFWLGFWWFVWIGSWIERILILLRFWFFLVLLLLLLFGLRLLNLLVNKFDFLLHFLHKLLKPGSSLSSYFLMCLSQL